MKQREPLGKATDYRLAEIRRNSGPDLVPEQEVPHRITVRFLLSIIDQQRAALEDIEQENEQLAEDNELLHMQLADASTSFRIIPSPIAAASTSSQDYPLL